MRDKEREGNENVAYLILTSYKKMFRADCPHYLLSIAALHYKQIVMTEPQRVLENPNFHGCSNVQFGLANGQAALTCQAPSFLPPYFSDQFLFFFAPFLSHQPRDGRFQATIPIYSISSNGKHLFLICAFFPYRTPLYLEFSCFPIV